MRDEIKEEVERQLRERDEWRQSWRRFGALLLIVVFSARLVWAQQHVNGVGGEHQMADLFKRFFTWSGTSITTVGDLVTTGDFYAGVGGLFSAAAGTGTASSSAISGSYAFRALVSGAKFGIGPGANSTLAEVSNGYLTSPSYIAMENPVPVNSVYVNNVIAALTYGGGTLPARALTVTNVSWNVRTAGSGGSTNNTFQISDGTNTCNCTMACNQSTGSKIASCSNGAGTGCVYAASAALTYAFSALGDCTVPMDVLGNMTVWGKWQ